MKKILLFLTITIFITLSGCKNSTQDKLKPKTNDKTEINTTAEQEMKNPIIKSWVDFNENGIDDYTDILNGARMDIANHPKYDGSYYIVGGYPPDDIGVCTDVIWRAFKNAGYSLKDMVDKDIKGNLSKYPRVDTPDPNIDFRRVKNLNVFFSRYAKHLTLDKTQTEEWNAGDIVVYKNPDHIAIISDLHTKDGVAYIVHNAGNPREADDIDFSEIIGHYRFDASEIDNSMLIKIKGDIHEK